MSNEADVPLSFAAWSVAATTLLSGPVALLVPIPQAPFWAGFALIAACVLLVARLASLGFEHHRTRAMLSLVVVGVYASMISVNYALQVAYVPALTRAADPALAYVTMANPHAPTWVLEMFGYAMLGIATGLVAPIVRGAERRPRWIRSLLRANAVVSIAGAVITAVNLPWVQTPAGLATFIGWNALLIAAMVLVGLEYAPRRQRAARARAHSSTSGLRDVGSDPVSRAGA